MSENALCCDESRPTESVEIFLILVCLMCKIWAKQLPQ